MPEVLIDWRDETDGNEIDYLAIRDGSVIACEAKAAAAVFLRDDPDGAKFSSVISRLGVDEAVLAFERLGKAEEDPAKLRKELSAVVARISKSTGIPVKFIVAEESPPFRDPPTEFGSFGSREQDLR